MVDRILAVDDDDAVLTMVSKIMEDSGFDVDCASSGEEALRMLDEGSYSLVLLDINMEGIDGFQTTRLIREKDASTPIIIVSGRKEDYDTIFGLDLGADDYVTKPFNPVILAAKAKALIRRSQNAAPASSQMIVAGPFRYDTVAMRFYKNEKEVFLSSKENALMRLFMDNQGRIFPKSVLYEIVWDTCVIDEGIIAVYMNRLRKKVEDDPATPKYIQTIRGFGYRFKVS